MKLSLYLVMLQLFFICPASASIESSDEPDQQVYKHCTFFKETESLRYVALELVAELSARSHLSFETVSAPIKRCIQMMIAGEIDFMDSVRVDPYTSTYMNFYLVSDGLSRIVFYTRKSDGNWLNDYEDLKGKTIGTSVGFGYFEKFDVDESLKKFPSNNPRQLPKLLEAGRIDAYVTYSGLLSEEGPLIMLAPYSVGVKMGAISVGKNSAMTLHHDVIDESLNSIVADGTMGKIMVKHLPHLNKTNAN